MSITKLRVPTLATFSNRHVFNIMQARAKRHQKTITSRQTYDNIESTAGSKRAVAAATFELSSLCTVPYKLVDALSS